jgi:hypothetical protein
LRHHADHVAGLGKIDHLLAGMRDIAAYRLAKAVEGLHAARAAFEQRDVPYVVGTTLDLCAKCGLHDTGAPRRAGKRPFFVY